MNLVSGVSGGPLDGPLEGHLLWNFASITPDSATISLFISNVISFSFKGDMFRHEQVLLILATPHESAPAALLSALRPT